MNNIDKSYQLLLKDILDNGVEKQDRTGTGTISVFGRQIRHKMSEGFPLLTTKKMAWKTIVTELLWFLRGDTNIKFLLDYDCHIWDGDAYKNYLTKGAKLNEELGGVPDYYSKEEFIKQIKTDKTFAKTFGDLGPIYGKQWRQWQGWMNLRGSEKGSLWYDQILRLVHSLKTEPDSRRLMVSAWNVAELDQMVLPPCHYGFQVYTRELSIDERLHLVSQKYEMFDPFDFQVVDHNEIDELYPVPKRAISLMWNQRSVDTFLGLPFNIASYGLLLEIIAKEVGMISDELIGNLGDVHLYSNHIEQAKEQISREPYGLPKIEITERNWYQHQLVKERLGPKTFNDKILSYRPDCFELTDYQSHTKLRAPLSN
jgi:thymidylate synthase